MTHVYWVLLEEFEDTKGEMRICESKNRQDNTMAKGKGTIGQTDLQNTTQKKRSSKKNHQKLGWTQVPPLVTPIWIET